MQMTQTCAEEDYTKRESVPYYNNFKYLQFKTKKKRKSLNDDHKYSKKISTIESTVPLSTLINYYYYLLLSLNNVFRNHIEFFFNLCV